MSSFYRLERSCGLSFILIISTIKGLEHKSDRSSDLSVPSLDWKLQKWNTPPKVVKNNCAATL